MRIYTKKIQRGAVLVLLVFVFVMPQSSFAASTPSLGTAGTFGVLSTTFTRNIGLTAITGDVGYTTLSGGGTHTVSGTVFTPAPPQSGLDQAAALALLNGQACDSTFGSPTDFSLLPQPLVPGVYCVTAAASIGTGGVTLSGLGTYVFRVNGAFTSAPGAIVSLTAGAAACDVFWTPTSATTLSANNAFVGTLIDDAGITVGNTTSWTGRALAFNGTVTTDTDAISVPSCAPAPATLHIVKQVTNTHGGTSTPSLFNLHVKLAGTDVSGSPTLGTSSPGTSYSLSAGTYTVSEDSHSGYSGTFGGDCDAVGSVSLASGNDKTCTITNADIPATLHIITSVINGAGGTSTPSDFTASVKLSGSDIAGSPAVGTSSPGTSYSLSAGTYVVSETVDPSYTQSLSGDCDAGGAVTLSIGVDKTCTITNTYNAIVPPASPTPHVVASNSRNSASNRNMNQQIGTPVATTTVTATTAIATSSTVPGLPNTGFSPFRKNVPWNVIVLISVFALGISTLAELLRKRIH